MHSWVGSEDLHSDTATHTKCVDRAWQYANNVSRVGPLELCLESLVCASTTASGVCDVASRSLRIGFMDLHR